MSYRNLALLVLAVVVLYFGVAAFVLRFEASRMLFPHVADEGAVGGDITYRVPGRSGNTMLVRRYGQPHAGCVVFFPGQHGGISSYEKDLFPRIVAHGVSVFALSYPGQDGAPGSSDLNEIQMLVRGALGIVRQDCTASKTVFVGRSLGSMLAVYAAGAWHPAGLVLEGATPSLSSAIIVHLHAHWYSAPLVKLPIAKLLAHDYRIAEGLSDYPASSIVVFQGTADGETPIEALRTPGTLPAHSRLVAVQGGTHSNTYKMAIASYVQTILDLLRGHEKTGDHGLP